MRVTPGWPLCLCLFLVLLALVSASWASGNCTTAPSVWVNRTRVHFEVAGSRATAHAAKDGSLYGSNSLSWTFDGMVERTKTVSHVEGTDTIQNYYCVQPRMDSAQIIDFLVSGFSALNPIEPYDDTNNCTGHTYGGPPEENRCGRVEQSFLMKDLDCWVEVKEDTFAGFPRHTITTHYSSPSEPNMRVNSSYILLEGDYDEVRTDANGLNNTIQYRKEVLKVNYEIENFPWKNTDYIDTVELPYNRGFANNASWIGMWWNVSLKMEGESALTIKNTVDRTFLGMKSTDNLISLALDVSKIFEVDGFIYSDPKPLLNDIPYIGVSHALEWNLAVPLCSPGVLRFNHLWYDPGLTSLFSGSIAGSPDTPPSKSNNSGLTIGLAVGLTLGILLLVAILIIVTVKVPAVRNIFRPFAKRGRGTLLDTKPTTTEPSNSWTRAQTPAE